MPQIETSSARRRTGRGNNMPPVSVLVFGGLLLVAALTQTVMAFQEWARMGGPSPVKVAELALRLGLMAAVLVGAAAWIRLRRVPWSVLGLVLVLGLGVGVLGMRDAGSRRPEPTPEGEATLLRLQDLPALAEISVSPEEVEKAGAWRESIRGFTVVHLELRAIARRFVEDAAQVMGRRNAVVDGLAMADPLARARARSRIRRLADLALATANQLSGLEKRAGEMVEETVARDPRLRRSAARGAVLQHIRKIKDALTGYARTAQFLEKALGKLGNTVVACTAGRVQFSSDDFYFQSRWIRKAQARQRELALRLGCDESRIRLVPQWKVERARPTPWPTRSYRRGSWYRRGTRPTPTPAAPVWEELE